MSADGKAPGHRRTLLDFIVLSGGEGLSKIAGFVAFTYLARTLGKDGYGAVEFASGTAIFFSMMVDFGLGTIGAREAAKDRGHVEALAARIPAARLLVSLLALPLMAALPLVMDLPETNRKVLWLFAGSMIFFTWNQRWLFQGIEQMKVVAGSQLLRMTVFAALVLLFVQDKADAVRVGFLEIIAVGAMAGYFLLNQLRRMIPVGLDFDRDAIVRLYKDASSVGLGQMVWSFNQQTPMFFVAAFMAEDIPWLAGANRIFIALSSFSMLYHFNLFPTFSRLLRESKEEYLALAQSSFRFSVWGSSLLALGLSVVATPLFVLLFGPEYAPSGPVLSVMIWSLPLTLASGHPRWSLIAVGKQRFGLFSQIAGAASTAIAGLALVPQLGALGAAITNVVAAVVVWGVAQLYARRYVGPVPFLAASIKPAIGVGAGYLAAHFIDNAWIAGPVAGVVMVATAFALERKLVDDVKQLTGTRKAG